MNTLTLGFLIWALLATCVCLFIHGAKKDRENGSRVDGSDRPTNRAVASR